MSKEKKEQEPPFYSLMTGYGPIDKNSPLLPHQDREEKVPDQLPQSPGLEDSVPLKTEENYPTDLEHDLIRDFKLLINSNQTADAEVTGFDSLIVLVKKIVHSNKRDQIISAGRAFLMKEIQELKEKKQTPQVLGRLKAIEITHSIFNDLVSRERGGGVSI